MPDNLVCTSTKQEQICMLEIDLLLLNFTSILSVFWKLARSLFGGQGNRSERFTPFFITGYAVF